MKFKETIPFILSGLMIGGLMMYVGISYQENKLLELESLIQNNTIQTAIGLANAMGELAVNCQPINLNYQNQTIQLIWVGCLEVNQSR